MTTTSQAAAGSTTAIAELIDGPLDIIGDVHGEIDALQELLRRLGYAAGGGHPQGRRPVFVGDLCDRGPDSIAVMERVGELIDRGLAQCVLGNHELNLLRGACKEGNGWYFEHDHDAPGGDFAGSRRADEGTRAWVGRFVASLPIALRRRDLRVVHACWDATAVATLQALPGRSVAQLYRQFQEDSDRRLAQDGTDALARAEKDTWRAALLDRTHSPPFLPAVAKKDVISQMGNPVRILTSGVERITATPFFSSGRWRMVERVAWWRDYADTVPVVIGHYWRWRQPIDRGSVGKGGIDLFAGVAPEQALGRRGNVYCVDFSVGKRYLDRARAWPTRTHLAALRWPERTLVFDC